MEFFILNKNFKDCPTNHTTKTRKALETGKSLSQEAFFYFNSSLTSKNLFRFCFYSYHFKK